VKLYSVDGVGSVPENGSTAVLEGSIAAGESVCFVLRARNCRTGEVIDEEQLQAARKETC